MSRVEKAISYFMGDYNCAQTVLGSYCSDYGLDQDLALKIASGFGGGMGRFGRTCGAISGALMVIGLKYGMGANDPLEFKEKTYQIVREFSNRFQEIHGSVICKELLECDINTPEGKDYYERNEFFEKKCLQYVKSAVKILEDLL
jgi:C_GCAxxG_C_C family probable redox protein